jgi:hypothetical protein
MTTKPNNRKPKRKAIGADLIIPALAVAFTIYYYSTVWELNWEAKADGLAIGALLILLVAVFLVRTALQMKRGEATLGMDKLLYPLEFQGKRWGLTTAIVVFIAALPYLGFTLGLFLFMCASLFILGVRKPRPILATAFSMAAGGYVLFIALLDTRFPHGPIEYLLARIF